MRGGGQHNGYEEESGKEGCEEEGREEGGQEGRQKEGRKKKGKKVSKRPRALRAKTSRTVIEWTAEKVELLRLWYPKATNQVVAKKLGFAVSTVVAKATLLGLRKSKTFVAGLKARMRKQ